MTQISDVIEEKMAFLSLRLRNLLQTAQNSLDYFGRILQKKALEIEAVFLSGIAPPEIGLIYLLVAFTLFNIIII